jgi:hypothetical protein
MRSALVVAACLSAAVLPAQVPQSVDPGQIPAYKVIAPGVVAAGREAGLKGATMEDAVRRLVAPQAP